MTVHNATAANIDLWTHYLDRSWGRVFDAFGQQYIAQAIATGVASWLALLAGPQIAWMYGVNAPDVNTFLRIEAAPGAPALSDHGQMRTVRPQGTSPATKWAPVLREADRPRKLATSAA